MAISSVNVNDEQIATINPTSGIQRSQKKTINENSIYV